MCLINLMLDSGANVFGWNGKYGLCIHRIAVQAASNIFDVIHDYFEILI